MRASNLQEGYGAGTPPSSKYNSTVDKPQQGG